MKDVTFKIPYYREKQYSFGIWSEWLILIYQYLESGHINDVGFRKISKLDITTTQMVEPSKLSTRELFSVECFVLKYCNVTIISSIHVNTSMISNLTGVSDTMIYFITNLLSIIVLTICTVFSSSTGIAKGDRLFWLRGHAPCCRTRTK